MTKRDVHLMHISLVWLSWRPSWPQIAFCNKHSGTSPPPVCPRHQACQMVAMCFEAMLCNFPVGWWGLGTWRLKTSFFFPQAASIVYPSLLYKYYHWLCMSLREKYAEKYWCWVATQDHQGQCSRVWTTYVSLCLLSPGMLCWECILCSYHSKQGY